MRPILFGRIFIVCVVGIGVPLTRALMYALFFWLKSCQQVQGDFSMRKVYETVNFDDLYKNVDELINNKKSFSKQKKLYSTTSVALRGSCSGMPLCCNSALIAACVVEL